MALTILDAGVIIGVLDGRDVHHEAAKGAVAAAIERGDALTIPASAYAECLVGPARHGSTQIVDDFLADLPAEVEPITRQVAMRAAQLRAQYGRRVRLPDAFVLATALHLHADRVVTTHAGWPRAGVPVDVLR